MHPFPPHPIFPVLLLLTRLIVVCNSLRSTFELLERRSANYSDRPRFIMGQEILDGGLMFALMNQDDR